MKRVDMPEASEIAWGAAAHYLKSIAKRRGWREQITPGLVSRIVEAPVGRERMTPIAKCDTMLQKHERPARQLL